MLVAAVGAMALWLAPCAAQAADDAGLGFFTERVGPLLESRCLECHGPKQQKGGLRLDSRGGWQVGGESGPSVVPGKPDESLLIDAVRYQSLQMPPKGKLSADEIAVLERWVARGAPDPREKIAAQATAKKPTGMTLDEARHHWSFQPIADPEPPQVHDTSSVRNDIDRFVLARLEAEHMHPNPPADRRTLIRRAYFDLIGLPPSYEEVEAFVADSSNEAFGKVVDRLLARQEYGQRWARHWLDVARYADTHEDNVTNGDSNYLPFAYTYRDYVVEAFNTDKPYDRFVQEQLAADKLERNSPRELAALGFQNVGRRFKNVQNLVMDDRIDTVTRGFLGLTVACSRCHDHKFDAIPTADYYSLYGVFASTRQPLDLPEIGRSGDKASIAKYLAGREDALRKFETHIDNCVHSFDQQMRDLATEYLRYIVQTLPKHRTTQGDIPMDTPRGTLRRDAPLRWKKLLEQTAHRFDSFFAAWHALAAFERQGFADKAARFVVELDDFEKQQGHGAIHPWVKAALGERRLQSMLDVADLYGELIRRSLDAKGPAAESIRNLVFFAPESPIYITRPEIEADLYESLVNRRFVERQESVEADNIRNGLAALERKAPVQRAMIVVDSSQPFEPAIFIRGNPEQRGQAVPRKFLTVLGHAVESHAGPYRDAGRKELAQAIASRDNPLTARVIVNRVWQQHFGQGLVNTADDFGQSGDRPSHPELLDHLATWFMDHGWSLKHLHRYILSSATWRQSSADQPACRERDPGNRWLWKMQRRRLEFEPLRDSLLAVAGQLDTRLDGPPQRLTNDNYRRAIYGLTDRYAFPTLLQSFDVAAPDSSVAERVTTTVPQQALFMMNSPFVEQRAAALVARTAGVAEGERRVERLYELALSRRPDAFERKMANGFLREADPQRWQDFAQALLMSNEFVLID